MTLVLKMKNVVVDNPNLMTLGGYYPNAEFGEVWVDFGGVDAVDSRWNKVTAVYSSGLIPSDLLRSSDGNQTGVRISADRPVSFGGGSSGDESGAVEDATIADDYIYVGAYTQSGDSSGSLNIDGLVSGRSYNLEIFSHRAATGDSKIGTYSANGIEVVHNAAAADSTFILNGVVPDADGRIVLTIAGNAPNSLAYLNFMKIIEV